MKLPADELRRITTTIFSAAGCEQDEAERIARHLVEANLVGHDSHGVIRIALYVGWLREGLVVPNQQVNVVFENDAIAVLDGQSGFGQSIGEQAVQMGIDKCSGNGVSVVALRNAGHLGRIGDWPEMAARAGYASLHYVNTSGKGLLVAPFGGISRRLSANPIAAGVPVEGREPIVLDISACTVAEGKIRVAMNKGTLLPDGCVIDGKGNPTNDPRVFYGDPGAILPFGGHKGYGLSVIAEVMAGALTGGGCTNPQNSKQLHNGMLSIYLDPSVFQDHAEFHQELNRFIDYVKSSQTVTPDGDILMPGEIEARNRAQRTRDGVELDPQTWRQIYTTAASLGVSDGLPEPETGADDQADAVMMGSKKDQD